MTIAALALLSAAAAAEPPPGPPDGLLALDAAAPFIDATIAGKPVRLRVDLGAKGDIELNRAAVRRLGLLSLGRVLGELAGVRRAGTIMNLVGPVRVQGEWAAETLTVAGVSRTVRVSWVERDFDDAADGSVTPALLPFDEVRIVRRPREAADRDVAVPVRLSREHGLQAVLTLGDEAIDLEFEPHSADTLATATAGAMIGSANGGLMTGEVRRLPVHFGIARPTRVLELARPLEVAGFLLPRLHVRVGDWAGDNRLPPDAKADRSEIVVTGRIGWQRPWAKLELGADVLGACAAFTYRQLEQRVVLTCPSGPDRDAADHPAAPG